MMLTRVTPFREMLRFEPTNWVDWPWELALGLNGLDVSSPHLRFDVVEKDDAYEISADLPGVKRDDVKIHVNGRDLEIVAETKSEEKLEEDGKLLRSERLHGRLQRRLTLAEDLDAEKAKASYEDGVLKITLPKSKNAKRKQLKVH